jgi:AcrR family transcriptional regulator
MAEVEDDGASGGRLPPGKSNGRRSAVQPRAPRHSARATRRAGQRMRSRLLDAASALFKAHGLNGTSITAIAGAADAFPSQVILLPHQGGSVHRGGLPRHAAHRRAGREGGARARTPEAYRRALVDSVTGADDGLTLFIEALALARQRQDLVPQIARTIERLHVEGARAYAGEVARHGWRSHAPADATARRFWALALGIALEGHATGRSASAMSAALHETLGELAEVRAHGAGAAPKLHLVGDSDRATPRSKGGSS